MSKYVITHNQLIALSNALSELPYKVVNGPMQLINHILTNQLIPEDKPTLTTTEDKPTTVDEAK